MALFQNLRYSVLLWWDEQCGPVSGASSDQLHLFLSGAEETRTLSLLIQSDPMAVSSSAPSGLLEPSHEMLLDPRPVASGSHSGLSFQNPLSLSRLLFGSCHSSL